MVNMDGCEAVDECIRVLVVDDIEIAREALKVFLCAYDDLQPVGAAKDGLDALRLCDLVQPDVVLMDIAMPGMDGITATRLLRQKYPRIQIIALSNAIDPSFKTRALEMGAFAYLTKGVSAEEIADTIRASVHLTLPQNRLESSA